MGRPFRVGAPGHDIYPDLQVMPEDEIVLKYRFSAFLWTHPT